MNYMRISSVGGLFHEFYEPIPNGLTKIPNLDCKHNILDATNLFWSLIFDTKNIKKVLNKVKPTSPKHIAIMANVELFIKQIEVAKKSICSQDITSSDFFQYLETLSIVCSLYSEYVYYPHRLTIQNGFENECFSASKIYINCLEKEENPYLRFIEDYVMPQLRVSVPQVIFVEGKPSLYNMTICRLVKTEFPQVHISLSRHSSEYYSLNKLETHLVNNVYLFKMVDSIILEYFQETERALINALENNIELSDIHNLVYKHGDKIIKTSYQANKNSYIPNIQEQYPASKLVNVHLQPYIMCYWNKCTFCGINKKYHFLNSEIMGDTLIHSLSSLNMYLSSEVKYIWFIDEAIHPTKLKKIASFFIEKKLNIFWQVRCRIDELLLEDKLVSLLQKSGLKEIRLGLESASTSILESMNKFDANFSLELVDKICGKYSSAGISVHFPMIIGFPGESSFERKKTFLFLEDLCKKYPLVSFNINVFNLDISSYVYKHPSRYEIEEIYYPCPLDDFLDNILYWKRNEDTQENQLFRERDQFMREILYPWMPINSFVKPYLFYRLSETIRNTLIWKCKENHTIIEREKSSV